MCMTPSAKAASVPMRICRCLSARRAVRLLRGSITMTGTPRFCPAYRSEFAVALGAGAAQRRLDALRRMHEFGVAVDLGAGEAGGEGLLRVAAHAQHAAILDLGQQRAHVGAVMRADDANRFH